MVRRPRSVQGHAQRAASARLARRRGDAAGARSTSIPTGCSGWAPRRRHLPPVAPDPAGSPAGAPTSAPGMSVRLIATVQSAAELARMENSSSGDPASTRCGAGRRLHRRAALGRVPQRRAGGRLPRERGKGAGEVEVMHGVRAELTRLQQAKHPDIKVDEPSTSSIRSSETTRDRCRRCTGAALARCWWFMFLRDCGRPSFRQPPCRCRSFPPSA